MAMTNAQRQANYREKRLKNDNGTGSRLNLVIDYGAHLALKRLALRYGVTITALVERLAMDEQARLTASMSADEHITYCDSVTA
ncbi:MAG: hypothetical protein Q8O37_17495 [Sulfuricellaceae bacterium]|nr:hypothetical protein [Sulfuricellaceae bacterium]